MLREQEARWHRLVRGKYKLLAPGPDGILRSVVFPGLWLDAAALFKGDMKRVMEVLQQGIASPEHGRFVTQCMTKKE